MYTGEATAASADRSAHALASLDYGVMRASTVAGNVPFSSASYAQAYFRDTIHFTNSSGAPAVLGIVFRVDGDIVAPNPAWSAYVGGYAQLSLSGCGACGNNLAQPIAWADNGKPVGNAPTFNFSTPGIYAVTDFGNFYDPATYGYAVSVAQASTHLTGMLTGSLVIPTGETSIGIGAILNLDCRENSVCSFENTAAFAFDPLPDGLSYTSLSGVFGTASVPEPSAWALLIAGLALCGQVVRRRRGQ